MGISAVTWLASLCLNLSPAAEKQLKELQDSLPEKAVTLDFVMNRAIQSSDSFKGVVAEAVRVRAPLLSARSPFDPRASLQSSYEDSDLEPATSFQPRGSAGWESVAAVDLAFPTGTDLKISAYHEKKELRFSSSPVSRYHFTQGQIEFSQNLLKDALGFGSRAAVQSGAAATQALYLSVLAAAENWWMTFSELFYRAWLSQREVAAAREGLERREEIKKITQRRAQRGTSVSSDLLQVEAAALASATELSLRQSRLMDVWRALVVSLYLPEEFLKIDPAGIPIKLDSPREEANALCKKMSDEDIRRTNSPAAAARAAAYAKEQARVSKSWDSKWNLEAFGSLAASNSEPGFSDSVSDTLGGANSGWMLGLRLNVPIFRWRERADLMQASSEEMKAQVESALASSSAVVNFRNACELLRAQLKGAEDLANVLEKQRKREAEMRKRFRIGDVSAFEVVQAGDDMTNADTALHTIQAQSRLTAWKVMATAGILADRLRQALEARGSQK